MKTTFIRLLGLSAMLALCGCAGMPDMKNMPIGVSSLKGLVPGGSSSSSSSLLDAGLAAGKSLSEATREIPENEEIAMGEELMQTILGAAPLYNNDRIQRYVNRVGHWIAMHSERPGLPWRFAVLDSNLANAGAAPGGQIYITTGLLFRMRSEAELAGALGHEVAHVVQKHHLKAYQKAKFSEAGLAVGSAAIDSKGGSGLAKEAKKFAIGQARSMILLSLGRDEEEQADRMGMVLAARAGYDPYGLPTVIQILQDLSKEQSGLSLLYSTHPTPSDRLAALEKTVSRELEIFGGQPTLADRFVTEILGTPPPPEKKESVPAKAPAKAPSKALAKVPPTNP